MTVDNATIGGESISREIPVGGNSGKAAFIGYTVESNCRLDRMAEVGMPAWGVYCAMARHAKPDDNSVWPSLGRLARLTGLCERSVRNAITCLVQHGWITRERRLGKNGVNTSNRYRILHHPTRTQAEWNVPIGGMECQGDGARNVRVWGSKCQGDGAANVPITRHEMYPEQEPEEQEPEEQEPEEQEPEEQEPRNKRTDDDEDSFVSWKNAHARAKKLQSAGTFKVRGERLHATESDRLDVLRACRLAEAGTIKPSWLDEAAQRTRDAKPTDDAFRYFLATLRGLCEKNGLDFGRAAAKLEVPEFLRRSPARPRGA